MIQEYRFLKRLRTFNKKSTEQISVLSRYIYIQIGLNKMKGLFTFFYRWARSSKKCTTLKCNTYVKKQILIEILASLVVFSSFLVGEKLRNLTSYFDQKRKYFNLLLMSYYISKKQKNRLMAWHCTQLYKVTSYFINLKGDALNTLPLRPASHKKKSLK